jgi:hypothetical protein
MRIGRISRIVQNRFFLATIAILALGLPWLAISSFHILDGERAHNIPPRSDYEAGNPSPGGQPSPQGQAPLPKGGPFSSPQGTLAGSRGPIEEPDLRRPNDAEGRKYAEEQLAIESLRRRENLHQEAKRQAEQEVQRKAEEESQRQTAQSAERQRAEAQIVAQAPDSKRRKIDADADCRRRLSEKGIVLPQNAACIDVDKIVRNLAKADFRFNKPAEAYVGEAFRVVLLLPTASGQDVQTPFKSTEGTIETRKAPYAQNMEATLRGDSDLKISPVGPQERVTTSLEPTTWEWAVVSEKAGDKTLVIEVNAQLVLGAERNRVQLRTIYEDIHVHVRWAHWFSAIWGFINSAVGFAVSMATLAIGVLGVLHYRRFNKTEDLPGVDLVGHQAAHHEQDAGGDHQPEGHKEINEVPPV